jgi:hypothetical protein
MDGGYVVGSVPLFNCPFAPKENICSYSIECASKIEKCIRTRHCNMSADTVFVLGGTGAQGKPVVKGS